MKVHFLNGKHLEELQKDRRWSIEVIKKKPRRDLRRCRPWGLRLLGLYCLVNADSSQVRVQEQMTPSEFRLSSSSRSGSYSVPKHICLLKQANGLGFA